MKKIKLLAKILFCFLVLLSLLVAGLHFALVYFAPLDSVKAKIINTVHEQTLADIKIGSISASIFDFHVKDIELNIENQNIAKIDSLYIHFSLIKLLKGQLKVNRITIENMDMLIVKDKQGKFNFDPILESPMFKTDPEEEAKKEEEKNNNKEDEKTNPLDLLLNSTQLQNCNITYIDEQSGMTIALSETSFDMKSFKFDNFFKIDFFTDVYLKTAEMEIQSLDIALSANASLNEMDLTTAEIQILSFVLRLKDTIITTKGVISDFTNPKANILVKIINLCSESFSEIADLPEFKIPEIRIQTLTNVNLDNSLVKIEKFDVSVLDSTINASGNLNYGKEQLEYNINVIINFILDKIHNVTKLINPYNPTGTIKANLNITHTESVLSGNISLFDISAFTPQLGNFTEINSQVNINSINDIKIPSLTGKLNKYPFKSSASYVIGKDKGTITANFTADRFYGKMAKGYEQETAKEEQEKKIEQETTQKDNKTEGQNKVKEESSLPPLDILVSANVKDMDVPYFMGKNIDFKMNMKKVTSDMNNVVGTLSLTTDNGTIKDIYKLTEANTVVKVMFMSLKIVSDVINALNVLEILGNIGSALLSSDKEEENITEMTEEHAQEQSKKIDGKIDFLSFITSINFEEGKGLFDKCSFVSNLLSFKVTGEINFKDDLLKMTVNAAPGRHEDDGIMPLTMKIGGTMEEPSGSLSLLGSVTTLVGDALMKNAVSDTLKSGFTKLLGLKKHDENGNEIIESTDTINTNSIETSTETETTVNQSGI
ncbi:AsmA family protein [Candidatus Ruminimicrobiellum ovillum]|uniref:AsmA family protein n=1 Tax=Candidatus Ruminimicrobiellum ovillum TaxID=1947927 RepID=UPI00355AC7CF